MTIGVMILEDFPQLAVNIVYLQTMGFANADDVDPEKQIPAHKSYAVRCEAVKKKFLAKKGAMEAAFKKKVCGCLGCCDEDPQCYFGQTYQILIFTQYVFNT